MNGVISLSGYLYTANAHTLAFAIYINRQRSTPSQVAGRYRSLVDMLCDFFLRQKPDNHPVAQTQNPYQRIAFKNNPQL